MIDVAFTPAAIRPARVAVMIDVLRASSSIAQALAAGYRRVLCCESVEEAEALRAPGRVIAGERGGLAPQGFDLGNSPAEFQVPRGDELVLSTTNGCPALLAAAESSEQVLVGCLSNLDALLSELGARDLVLVCAGVEGTPALEDVYMAGRIVGALGGEPTDTARIAAALALAYPDAATALAAADHAEALREVGLEEDLEWCARESTLDVVPRLVDLKDGVAVVEPTSISVASPARATDGDAT